MHIHRQWNLLIWLNHGLLVLVVRVHVIRPLSILMYVLHSQYSMGELCTGYVELLLLTLICKLLDLRSHFPPVNAHYVSPWRAGVRACAAERTSDRAHKRTIVCVLAKNKYTIYDPSASCKFARFSFCYNL